MTIFLYLLIGVLVGMFSGAFGVGGGGLMVPIFVLAYGMTQHQAQGTSLAAMLLPVFFFAVWRYHVAGNVNVSMAVFVSMGLFVGAFFGAHFVQGISDVNLRRAFGFIIICIGLKMIFLK